MKRAVCAGLLGAWLSSWMGGLPAAADEKKLSPVLNVYNWEDYLGPPEIVTEFEQRFGVKVNLQTFDDEDVMVSGVQSHPDQYDLIITSGRLIAELVEMRLLAALNLANIPNIANIGHTFRNPDYDPGNRFSVPYLWGTTALAVNHAHVPKDERSWAVLWNPAYKGKIAMLPSPPETVAAALKLLGYSLNSTDPKELKLAKQKLLEQRPLLAGYVETIQTRDKLISGELWAAQVYVGEGLVAANKNPDVEYLIPSEGATIWVDNLAIPRDAPHKYTAETFINYILEPQVSARIANYHRYADPNLSATPYVLPELLQNPALYLPDVVLRTCEVLQPLGTSEAGQRRQQLINQIWAELQRAPAQ